VHPEDQYALRVLKAGAAGYLNKESAVEELVIAVKRVLAGGRYVSVALGEAMAISVNASTDRPSHENLSDREFEVLRLIASGKTVGEISSKLSLSVKTISTYRTRALAKMKLKTNADLMRYAVDHHLTDTG
jgi:two-component system invasion response regulator UvrY